MGKILSADHGVLNIRVLGVMKDVPENTHFSPDFFFSIFTMPVFYNANVLKSWDDNIFYTYIRLSPDALPSALEQKLPLFIDKYTRQPENAGGSTLEPSLQAVTDVHLYSHLENELGANSDIAYIYILSSVALFMLLIACINFMNMATARAAGRAREVGLRKVIGANRLQLIRQFLGESILISVFALFLAAALVQMVIPVFNTFADKDLTLAFNESGLILGLVGITLFVGIVSGSYPAFFLSGFQPGAVLKESVKTGGGHAVLRKTLVVVQFAISTILIIGTAVVYDQLDYVRNKRLGFDKDHVITVPAAIQPILAVAIYMVWPLRYQLAYHIHHSRIQHIFFISDAEVPFPKKGDGRTHDRSFFRVQQTAEYIL